MQALDLVNGYNFKGKPIIIQYGRNKVSNDEDFEDEKSNIN